MTALKKSRLAGGGADRKRRIIPFGQGEGVNRRPVIALGQTLGRPPNDGDPLGWGVGQRDR